MSNDEQHKAFEVLVKKGMSSREAAVFSGYSPTNTRTPDKPTRRITKALERNNVNDDRLAKTLERGLDAATRAGSLDHNAITKYLSLAGKWLGYEREPQVSLALGLNIDGTINDLQSLKDAVTVIEAEVVAREQVVEGLTDTEGETTVLPGETNE